MKRLPDELVDQVRQATDIVELISERVELKKQGNRYSGLCPFHSEKSPSFSVSPDKGMYYCFGCGAGGNAITFVMETEGMSFPEAVVKLADRTDIKLPEFERSDQTESTPDQEKKYRMREAHRIVADLYHEVMLQTAAGDAGREYLEQRGIQESAMREFKLGYAPDQDRFTVDSLARRNFDLDEMVEAGLISIGRDGDYRDRFNGRVVFPISDRDGTIVGFSGRSIDGRDPKYVNTAETPLFNKSELLFGFAQARGAMRKNKQVVLVEGNLDVVRVAQAGIPYTVASLGTALTPVHAQNLGRIVDEVIVCYDGDKAGRAATLKALRLLEDVAVDCSVIRLPDGEDPDSFIGAQSEETFLRVIEQERISSLEFKSFYFRQGKNLRLEGERVRYIETMLEEIGRTSNPLLRDIYLGKLAEEFHLSKESLLSQVKPLQLQQAKPKQERRQETQVVTSSPQDRTFSNWKRAERFLLAYMIRSEEVGLEVRDQLGVAFNDPAHQLIAGKLYEFYGTNTPADPDRFLTMLHDASLQRIVADLEFMLMPEYDPDLLSHYIRAVQNERQRRTLDEEKSQLSQQTDIRAQAELMQAIIERKRRLKDR
ncbi:DNA primase [Exiguobacterium sp. PvP048]|uniref:DNA primase n=1 Tax=Exiguobacterium sibiricum (strain DSM 17290 / CCUG 55495 / CIP 109462 / JCM 13490 / 255-15) TaxID=262543 RepID=B1YL79_EXIS2|nr:DNA primase [Exiguobacterium sibiricum]ACB60311.1 DNA primase [Exiguobacterium sibiricum 255-15]